MNKYPVLFLINLSLMVAIPGNPASGQASRNEIRNQPYAGPLLVARLGQGLKEDFQTLRNTFRINNPGYDMEFHQQTFRIDPKPFERILFMQQGSVTATVSSGASSEVSVGDIIVLHVGEILTTDKLIDVLAFRVPKPPDDSIPRFIRPDWDPRITDTPGGCATDSGAYRRLLLTWLGQDGPYLYHALNAHRVRITDSFSHYHPRETGYDELYLVQMAWPGAKLITSEKLDLIQDYEHLTREDLPGLIQETPLAVGDLVYIPKGVVHRGYGGVLAQVITVPGYVPGEMFGVDHLLYKINRKFNLTGPDSLTYHTDAAHEQVVK